MPGPVAAGAAGTDDAPFSRMTSVDPAGKDARVRPDTYAASRVDHAALRSTLPSGAASAVVEIPDPEGTLQRFRVSSTQTMESELAAAHPEIRTWGGRGVDDERLTVALDITPMGFHAAVRDPAGQRAWFVDPATNTRGATTHLSYYGSELPRPEQRRQEGEIQSLRDTVRSTQEAERAAGAPVQRRYYRLAMASDPSYAAYFGSANVLAEKVTLVNRVNQVYNDDLAVTLRLVNATDELNLDTEAKAVGANGPCGAAPCFRVADAGGPGEEDDVAGDLDFCDVPTLGRNRTVLGQLVGAANYDVGHIALGKSGGGIAYLGVIGGDYKGGGCTGLPEPVGDFYAIDYVAHELGHQFGGDHTFDGVQRSCSGANREGSTSVEPGSGSSVMAYAGICSQDNLQPHSDPYFSQRSQEQVFAVMQAGPVDSVEVQTVSLRGFDAAGESFQLGFGDAPAQTIAFADYDATTVDTAVETLTGRQVSVVPWGFDEFGTDEPPTGVDLAGFQVIFNDTPTVTQPDETDTDLAALTVTSTSTGVEGFVGETAQGGPSQNGGTLVSTGNRNPTVTAPADKTLPMRTPFALKATGRDDDGNAVTYLWEQNDVGGEDGTGLVDNDKKAGPLFRVFGTAAEVSDEDSQQSPSPGLNLADGNPTRVFPDLAQILAGNTNAATGTCPPAPPLPPEGEPVPPVDAKVRECFSEFLPVAGYVGTAGSTTPAMNFRVTARDGFVNGGGTSYDDVTLRLDPSAGPFLVSSQATRTTLAGGEAATVTWKVNGTRPLARNVKISLSTDGGATFGTVLASSTANDGSQSVRIPRVVTDRARIKIEAVGNYFFDINDAELRIRP
ncbi:MAG: M12 family metallo-peptidase [Phycicoccus sp.]